MISEIDLLKEDLPGLENRFGATNPFVEVLKAQLSALQNPAELKPQQILYGKFLGNIRLLFDRVKDAIHGEI